MTSEYAIKEQERRDLQTEEEALKQATRAAVEKALADIQAIPFSKTVALVNIDTTKGVAYIKAVADVTMPLGEVRRRMGRGL